MATGTTSTAKPGRDAAGPAGIDRAGWRAVLGRVRSEFAADRVTLVAAGVAFYGILSLVPALAAFIAVYGLLFDPAAIRDQVAVLEGVVPGGGMEIIRSQVDRLASGGGSTLGIALLVSVLISLWSANAAMKSLFEAMNVAYDEREARGFVRLNAVTLAFTVGAMVGVAVLVALMVALPAAMGFLALGVAVEWAVRVASWALILGLIFLGVTLLYRYGPSREPARWRWLTPGAGIAVVFAFLASLAFSWYASNFGSYNATYGSLGAIIGFITWLWLVTVVLLAGAELDSEMEHQTARDTTTGPARPMGERGAVKADTLPED